MSAFLDRMAAASRSRVPTRPPAGRAPDHTRPIAGLIAEIKPTSPSDGAFAPVDLVAQAHAYVAGGAVALSVLTEPTAFGGSLDALRRVAAAVDVPVMRKDFVVHPHQVHEAAACGAAMVLLVVRLLDDATLDACLDAAARCGLTVLLEAFDADDLRRIGPRHAGHLVGVNSRDLQSLEVDPDRFARLADALPDRALAVAESGLNSPAQVRRARHAGFPLALVGTALMRSPEPTTAVQRLSSPFHSFRVKVCGCRTPADVDGALAAGADTLGVVMDPSPRAVDTRTARVLLRHVDGRAPVVAVVRQVTRERLDALLALGFDAVQGRPTHGLRSPRLLPVVDVDSRADGPVLLDASEGRGRRVDRTAAAAFVARRTAPTHIAGGLGPDDVAEAIAAVAPHGVDAASGLEDRPGHHDPERVRAFVQRARSAFARLPGVPHVHRVA